MTKIQLFIKQVQVSVLFDLWMLWKVAEKVIEKNTLVIEPERRCVI